MSEILHTFNQIANNMQPYFTRKYFLCFVGSIFLLGIVGQWVTLAIYRKLIKKAENMVSPKNKLLKQLKLKFENCVAVNGVVANPSLMVERYLNKYRFLGMSLENFAGIINICAVICLSAGGIAGFYAYEKGYDGQTIAFYILVGCFMASALDLYGRSSRIEAKEGELICIITDFLVNTMNVQERRQERTANTLLQMAGKNGDINSYAMSKHEEKRLGEAKNESNESFKDVLGEDAALQWEILHKELEEEEENLSEIDRLMQQEYIINEVLAEFL